MSRRLAPLRRSLDALPSPVGDRPGLLLRDPFGYTDEVVIIPPPLVVLGTSHYGAPERFGLTRKAYETPFGASRTDLAIVDRQVEAGGDAPGRGALLRYEPWYIDPANVVSFAALAFGERSGAAGGEGGA